MQRLLQWTLEFIREEDCFSWMEEHRYDWAPLVKTAVMQIAEGKSVLLLTDGEREWFERYVLQHVNALRNTRPLLPFYPMRSLFPDIASLKNREEIQLFEDMLDISFPHGYIVWYIGKGGHPFTKVAYRNASNFLWVLDEEVENSFTLRSSDKYLDLKLLQLFRLFDATLSEALFGDLEFDV